MQFTTTLPASLQVQVQWEERKKGIYRRLQCTSDVTHSCHLTGSVIGTGHKEWRTENLGGREEEPALLGVAFAQVLVATFSSAHALPLITDCTFFCV